MVLTLLRIVCLHLSAGYSMCAKISIHTNTHADYTINDDDGCCDTHTHTRERAKWKLRVGFFNTLLLCISTHIRYTIHVFNIRFPLFFPPHRQLFPTFLFIFAPPFHLPDIHTVVTFTSPHHLSLLLLLFLFHSKMVSGRFCHSYFFCLLLSAVQNFTHSFGALFYAYCVCGTGRGSHTTFFLEGI